ncbi:MAG: hypothetical protein DI563_29065, partial [Variovorax paradoxus]
ANGLLSDETDVRRARIDVMNNTAEGIASLGGAAIANGTTLARSNVEDLQTQQVRNTARNVRAGGGSGGAGWGAVAQADLTGVAAANAVTAAGSQLKGARITQQGNEVDGMSALGGSALANTVNLADYQGGDLRQ